MNRSTRVFSLLSAALLLAGALALTGCGGEEAKKTDKDDATTAADAEADGGATDTGSAEKDTGSSTTTDTGSTQKDTGPAPKTSCGDALLCKTNCPKGDDKCLAACVDNVTAADKTSLDELDTCAVDLCKEVTTGTADEQDCAFTKCFDKYKSCVVFGQGQAPCDRTAVCLAACNLTDFACRLKCMVAADPKAIAPAKAVAACVTDKCAGIKDQDKLATCVKSECKTPVSTCLGGAELDCAKTSLWIAKCPKPSAFDPNNCRGIVKGMAEEAARKAYDAYGLCKKQCLQAVNIVGCWGAKCKKEADACFLKTGSTNCQEIDQCVIKECDGIGGKTECIEKCLPKGKASSQDAYLAYEGCMVRNMETKDAKTAECKFPYDLAKCIPIIKGQYCGNESQACFTDQ